MELKIWNQLLAVVRLFLSLPILSAIMINKIIIYNNSCV